MSKIIVLDVDGTLVCTEIDWDGLREKIRKLYGIRHPLKPLGESLYKLFKDNEEELRRVFQIVEEAERESLNKLDYDPRLPRLLEALRNNGYRIIIVSMRSRETLEPVLDKLGIKGIVDEILTREEAHSRLSQLKLLVEKYGGENILFIGDTITDREAGKTLGVEFIKATCVRGHPNSIGRILERLLGGGKADGQGS